MRIRGFFVFLLVVLSLCAFSQDTTEAPQRLFIFDAGYIYGKVLNIHPFFPQTDNAQGLEFQFMEQTAGRRYWHQTSNYPVRGVSLVWMNLGNDSLLGNAIGAYYFHRHSRRIFDWLTWDTKIGAGIGVFTKHYDPMENPNNYVIGSTVTAFGAASTSFRFRVAKHFSLFIKGAFLHYSNGHVKVPNIGANLITGGLGVEYVLHPDVTQRKKHDLKPIKERWLFNIDLGLGFHEVEGTVLPPGGPLYPVYFGSLYASKRVKHNGLVQLGFNLNYFTDYYDFIINQQIFQEKERAKSYKGLVFVGYEWIYGRLAYNMQLGVNVYYPFRKRLIELEQLNDRWLDVYNTNLVMFKYYLRSTRETTRNNPFIGLGLRTIGGKADFIEVRVGVGF